MNEAHLDLGQWTDLGQYTDLGKWMDLGHWTDLGQLHMQQTKFVISCNRTLPESSEHMDVVPL